MNTTSLSFLNRLKSGNLQEKDIQRIKDTYIPLIRIWISCIAGLTDSSVETDDLAQDVFVVLLQALPTFERQRDGSFRLWLRRITVRRIWAFWKLQKKRPAIGGDNVAKALEQLEDPNSDLSQQWDDQHQQHVWKKLLALVKPDFEPQTWEAFERVALQGIPPADVAKDLGVNLTTIFNAKSRVLKRLREAAKEFLE